MEPASFYQLPQGILGGHVHHRLQFIGEVTCGGVGHQRCRSVQQGAVPRKLNVATLPQPQSIVLSDAIQRVVGPAMRIAAAVAQG